MKRIHIVPKYKIKYCVYESDGRVYGPYDDKNDFSKYWHNARKLWEMSFGTHFHVKSWVDDFHRPTHQKYINMMERWKEDKDPDIVFGAFILKNEFGDVVHPDEIREIFREYRQARRPYNHWTYTMYHRGFKPRTGNYFRHPKTQRDRRWTHAHDDRELNLRVRAKRSKASLPTCWEDIMVDRKNNNWKRYRKTQWKDSKKT
jgi:hypothetical protein